MASGEIVLVVDDNQAVRRYIESVLRPLGYKVETAADGIEALQRVLRGPVDLILLDFVMPRMNGYHFCKTLDEKGLAQDVPVVLLSSADERVAVRMKEMTRVVDSLAKPVRAGALREVITRNLRALTDPTGSEPPDGAGFDDGFGSAFEPGPAPEPIADAAELRAALRDDLHAALADALAERLDEIARATDHDEMLGIIAETVGDAIDDALLERIIELVRSTAG